MKTFLIFALLAVAATSAIAQMETSHIPGLEKPSQQQPLPLQQILWYHQQQPIQQQPQPFPQQPPCSQQQQPPLSQQQQPPFSQQQPPFSQQELPILPQQPPFSQQQQPQFSQQQQPFPQQQQPLLLQQPPFSQQRPPFSQQQQQPVLPQQPPFLQQQQQQPILPQQPPFSQHQQPVLPQQQIPYVQPSILQQLNPCKVFLQQQCSPVAMPQSLARSQMLWQSSCHVMQQQCCQQLPRIPEQSRYDAIRAIIYSIVLQEQQHGQGFNQPQQQQPQQSVQGVSQPQQQQKQLGQCSFQRPQQQQLGQWPQQQQVPQGTLLQPHQIAQLELMTSIALRTLPMMCSVNVPVYGTTTSVPFGVGTQVGAY
uniref:Low molecular weight glutenin subunit LMW.S6 n=1 Tax=Aegilops tauschii TaxID=37682 RepID=Q6J6V0_AEGTA|nr:low molecular weight glutenin subunit LMW.S6 precursor [Aegilops tauschii]